MPPDLSSSPLGTELKAAGTTANDNELIDNSMQRTAAALEDPSEYPSKAAVREADTFFYEIFAADDTVTSWKKAKRRAPSAVPLNVSARIARNTRAL